MKKFTLLLCTLLIALAAVVPVSAQKTWNSTQYPNPSQPSSTILPPFFKLKNVGVVDIPSAAIGKNTVSNVKPENDGYTFEGIVGDVVRVLHQGQYSFVLTHTPVYENKKIKEHIYRDDWKPEDHPKYPFTKDGVLKTESGIDYYYEPRLYFINHKFDVKADGTWIAKVYRLSLPDVEGTDLTRTGKGIPERRTANPGDYCKLSDIALTADGYLMGCNYSRVYYNPKGVETKIYKRDTKTGNEAEEGYIDGKQEFSANPVYMNGAFRIFIWNKSIKSLATAIQEEEAADTKTHLVIADATKDIHANFISSTLFYPTTIAARSSSGGGTDDAKMSWATANFNRSESGYTCAVSGSTAKDSTLIFTFTAVYHMQFETKEQDNGTYTYTYKGKDLLRFVHVPIEYARSTNNRKIDYRGITVSKSGKYTESPNIEADEEYDVITRVGSFFELDASPYNAKGKSWIIDGHKMTPRIFTQTKADNDAKIASWAEEDSTHIQLPSEYTMGNYPVQNNFFRYGGRNVMVSSYTDYDATTKKENNIVGVRLYDIRTKLSEAHPINLIGMLDHPIPIPYDGTTNEVDINAHVYTAAFAEVNGTELTIYYFVSYDENGQKINKIYTYTTEGVSQGRGIFAYGLNSTFDPVTNDYTFKFKTNEYPYKALLKIYGKDGKVAGQPALGEHVLIDNSGTGSPLLSKTLGIGEEYTVKIAGSKLTSSQAPGTELTWAIEMTDTTVYNWEEIFVDQRETSEVATSYVTVDKSPESPFFGNVYRGNMKAKDTADPGNGIVIYTPTDVNQTGKTTYSTLSTNTNSTNTNFTRPLRLAVDSTGKLYVPDFNLNIYTANPNNAGGIDAFTPLWTGTDGKKYITSVATIGTGDNAKLVIHNNTKTGYSDSSPIQIYNSDGTNLIKEYASPITHENGGGEANVIPTSKGYFRVKANTPNGENNPVLLFYPNGATKPSYSSYNANPSASSTTRDQLFRSHGGGATVTSDEKYLIVNTQLAALGQEDKTSSLRIMEIHNDATTNANDFLTHAYNHEHDFSAINQMSLDYGGNLYVAGEVEETVNSTAESRGILAYYAMPKVGTTTKWKGAVASPAPVEVSSIISDNPAIINRTETPARSLNSQAVYQLDGYDRVFDNGGGTGNWNDPANWFPNPNDPTWQPNTPAGTPVTDEDALPQPNHRVRIDAPVTISTLDAVASYIDINTGAEGTNNAATALTITPMGGLTVGGAAPNNPLNEATAAQNADAQGRIRQVTSKNETVGTNPTTRTDRTALAAKDILIQASGTPNAANAANSIGSLALHNNDDGTASSHNATVQIDKRYTYSAADNKNLTWQLIGIPFDVNTAGEYFHKAWMYQWNEAESLWEIIPDFYADLNAWQGYLLTSPPDNSTYSLAGALQPSSDHTFNLTCAGATAGSLTNPMTGATLENITFRGANYLANSWTAPIQISKLKAGNFVNCDKTIYLYAPTLRKYVAIPVGTAKLVATINDDDIVDGTGKDIAYINPMQGFFVKATSADAKLTLDYSEVVSTDEQPAYVTDAQLANLLTPSKKAPALAPAGPDQTPVMRIYVRGADGNVDNVVLIEDEDYTLGFDNGYDGRKMEEGADIPYLTAASNDGDMAVLATPSIYGTFLNFRKGNAKTYTLEFDYNVEETDLVLQDLMTKQSVDIVAGNTYTFTTTESDTKARFRISHREDSRTDYDPTAYVANGQIYLDNPTNELLSVSVFTVDGKLVQHITTREALTDLHVPNQGLYLIEITMGDNVFTVKQIL